MSTADTLVVEGCSFVRAEGAYAHCWDNGPYALRLQNIADGSWEAWMVGHATTTSGDTPTTALARLKEDIEDQIAFLQEAVTYFPEGAP